MAKKTGGLGQGLDALFYENAGVDTTEVKLRLSEIEPNKDQPRKDFDADAISELAESIRRHGLIQPILVRPLSSGRYQIVAGERRWRACREAGIDRVPVIIRELDDQKTAEIALIENLQREDLNAVEEAKGYRQLMDKFGLTQDGVAERVGKSRPAVANALRLLGLDEKEMKALSEGRITAGHARALLALSGDVRAEGFRMALDGATVREIEKLGKEGKKTVKRPRTANKLYKEVELSVSKETGRHVSITGNGKSGTLHIEFFDDDDLCALAGMLTDKKD